MIFRVLLNMIFGIFYNVLVGNPTPPRLYIFTRMIFFLVLLNALLFWLFSIFKILTSKELNLISIIFEVSFYFHVGTVKVYFLTIIVHQLCTF